MRWTQFSSTALSFRCCGLLRELGLPETLLLAKHAVGCAPGPADPRKLSQRQRCRDEDDLDTEQESELPDLFQESMIEERIASVMFKIEMTTRDSWLRVHAEVGHGSGHCLVGLQTQRPLHWRMSFRESWQTLP
jgi:hypothetical protein